MLFSIGAGVGVGTILLVIVLAAYGLYKRGKFAHIYRDAMSRDQSRSPSILTRLSSFVFGDPRKAPKRLVTLFVALLFGVIVTGIWFVATSNVSTSGSSGAVVGPIVRILTSVWIVPIVVLWVTRKWVLFRLRRAARISAEITGWSVKTVKHLRDEIRTTDGCTRIITSTGDDLSDIEARIDAALSGEKDDDTVDFWKYQADHADDFDISHEDYTDDETRREMSTDGPLSGDSKEVHDRLQQGYMDAVALATDVHDSMSESAKAEPELVDEEIPWRVRFFEEVKHLWLDLQSGFRTGEAVIRFGVPAAIAYVFQLFIVGLWTSPILYLLFIATSTAVGLSWLWLTKRRRHRRLKRYRADSDNKFWLDCAGQFKTVETADVTAYMAFIAGRRYASYDRQKFIKKTARTMHEHVTGECVAPSELQHHARCLDQMKPNLKGHRENILQPAILRELKQTVEAAEDEIIPKAELAWSAIEQPTTSRIEKRLGHDPDLVRDEYRFLVEDAHVLDERDVEFRDANGEINKITIVFPADKNRLPDVSERHSQFSDRFTDKKGEPVYKLPDVDPRDSLSGFVPTPRAAALFNGADPAAIADAE